LLKLRKTKREIRVDGERIEVLTTHPKPRAEPKAWPQIFNRQHA
jgi:hypothetical protein